MLYLCAMLSCTHTHTRTHAHTHALSSVLPTCVLVNPCSYEKVLCESICLTSFLASPIFTLLSQFVTCFAHSLSIYLATSIYIFIPHFPFLPPPLPPPHVCSLFYDLHSYIPFHLYLSLLFSSPFPSSLCPMILLGHSYVPH